MYKLLYEKAVEIAPNNVSQLILAVAEGQYRAAFVVDAEINACATLINVLQSVS